MQFGRYRKFVVAIAGAAVVGFNSYYGPGTPIVTTFIAVATALGVYATPNV